MVRFALIVACTMLAVLPAAESVRAQNVPVPTPNPLSKQQPQAKDAGQAQKETEGRKQEAERIYQAACPAVLTGRVKAAKVPPIMEEKCGERSPLEVHELAGFRLSAKATLNCRMATQLAGWIEAVDSSARQMLGSGLSSVSSSTSYQCRRRNNAPDGKISEHGFANAFDIVGFSLENGQSITLTDHWGTPDFGDDEEKAEEADEDAEKEVTAEGRFLREIRDRACERFTTVLSPDSNPLHADHFHFDLGCHGKKCTYRICE